MEVNKILSASILDLVFDGRNKEYGAYELRATYPQRVKKSLIVVFIIGSVAITGAAIASSFKSKSHGGLVSRVVAIHQIEADKKLIPPPPTPPKPQPQQTRTIQYKTPVITNEEPDPMPDKDEIDKAIIDDKTRDGIDDNRIVKAIDDLNNGTDIIEKPKEHDNLPLPIVEVDAKFNGNWEKFLRVNLYANIPVENGAPAGRYTVIIQFVVDVEGNVSDIQPLTAHGYGMEAEAVRVLKKALKWEPAFQNGQHVKAYRKQPITFVVEAE